MKNYTKPISLVLLAMLVFIPLQSAAAGGLMDGQVIFGQSFTLKSGETLNGDLVVFGGSATIENGALVKGSTVLFGGNLVINGEVNGDVAIVGGVVTLGTHSQIHGNLSTVGASLDRSEGSQIDGEIFNTATSWIGNGENANQPQPPVVTPPVPVIPNFHVIFDPLWSVMNVFGNALALAVLAMLVVLFLAPQTGRVAGAITSQPIIAGGLGLLTVILAPAVVVLLTITILLIPIALIAIIVLVVAGVFGWIAIGLEIGQRFVKAIHQDWHPSLAAGLGTFVLTLVARALTAIPVLNCVGWLVPFLLGVTAIGAVIMTRFGMRLYAAPTVDAAITPASPSGENLSK